MFFRFAAAVAATLLFTNGAIAQDTAAPQAKPALEKKICRSVVPTGSIMGKRICLTRKEWAEFNSRNEQHNDMYRDNRNKTLRPEER